MPRTFPVFLLILGFAASLGRAQAPADGVPLLREPLDWGPGGAWRRRAAAVRTTRDALLRAGNFAALNAVQPGRRGLPFLRAGGGAATAVAGAFHIPVIPIAYRNVALPYTAEQYQCILFSQAPGGCAVPGTRPYSVATYYEELSHLRITMDGVVFPAVTQDSAAAFYTDGCKGITVGGQTSCPARPLNRMAAMLVATLNAVSNGPDAATVWSQFDNDGPDGMPNSGDDDGVVDFVTFLQPEVGGECVNTSTTGIWSHRYRISAWTGSTFTTQTPRRGSNGQPIPGQFLQVNDYTIQSGLGGSTSCDGNSIMAIGTVAHETGHAFGLPDLYDTDGGTQGIGGWGLMGSGNYARPYSPSSFDAWSLQQLGWATIDTLGTSRTVTAGARQLSDTIFYARTDNADDYLLIENRQAVLSDTAQMNPALAADCPLSGLGFCAKSPGLLLWIVNRPRVALGLGGGVNSVNTGTLQGVALIQADGLNQLRTPGSRNRGDRGDSYPGSTGKAGITLASAPSARDNVGEYLGFVLDSIQQLPGTAMRFRFTRRRPSVLAGSSGAQVRVNGATWDRFDDVIPGGDLVQLSADAVQTLAAGRSRATFLSWSDGGAREHTLVSAPARPDTVTAQFTVEHRLLLTTSGSGSVTSSIPGDLAQGVFLAAGTNASLAATAGAGFIFAGWRGDTVATGSSLSLRMGKGYELEARFVANVAVAAEDAVSDVLGVPKLTDPQRLFLDELGNRNGILDVGDILAMYRRSGQAVPAAVLQAARRRP